MKESRRYLGKWELGCMVFHACLYKMFTAYPSRFQQISGSAATWTALYSGAVFLAVLWIVLSFKKRYADFFSSTAAGRRIRNGGHTLLAVYWLFGIVYALRSFLYVLKQVAYTYSPEWYLLFFMLLGSVVTVLCGAKAVYRMHSLWVPFLGIVFTALTVMGLKYARPTYITPIFGSGALSILRDGLSTLFLYSDIALIFTLLPRCRRDVRPRRTVMTGAALAVGCNILLVWVSSMSCPSAMREYTPLLLYPLTKAAYFGKLRPRMDALYLTAFLVSALLYLSMALYTLSLILSKKKKKTLKKKAARALCLLLCFSLCGCYDSREIDEAAYVIALGIDTTEDQGYTYTFQLSNPLAVGGTQESANQTENQTVSHFSVTAQNFYTAREKLKSYLGKTPDLSHVKVIVFSKETARQGIWDQAILLYQNAEVRPDVHVALSDAADQFLYQVKPILENSTSRYYELLFQDRNTPYAPITVLRDFVNRAAEGIRDPVMPILQDHKIEGLGIFRGDALIKEMTADAAMMYKMLSGEAEETVIHVKSSAYLISVKGSIKAELQQEDVLDKIFIKPRVRARLLYGDVHDAAYLAAEIQEKSTDFIKEIQAMGVDVLGIGESVRTEFLSEKAWSQQNWKSVYEKAELYSQPVIKHEKR